MSIRIINGDALTELAKLPAASVDSCVTDPPYHLTTGKKGGTGPASVNLESPYGRARVTTGFMGMTWDGGDVAHNPALWAEVLRVLKPGAYLLAFGGTRTYHRLACAIEDAGFEIRDQIGWAFGSGFPKSHNGEWGGTALKPAWEPIVMARKPLIGTVAENILQHGTGGLNIDGCRVETAKNLNAAGRCAATPFVQPVGRWPANLIHDGSEEVLACFPDAPGQQRTVGPEHGEKASINTFGDYGPRDTFNPRGDAGSAARFFKECRFSEDDQWPLHESNAQAAKSAENPSSSCATSTAAEAAETKTSDFKSEESPASPGCTGNFGRCTPSPNSANAAHPESTDTIQTTASHSKSNGYAPHAIVESTNLGDRAVAEEGSGLVGATRFLYCPKASREDRNEGCDALPKRTNDFHRESSGLNQDRPGREGRKPNIEGAHNHHPTVKPTNLMRYLCRLVTPKGGTVLDPFMGSGSTGRGAIREGFDFIGIEIDAEYCEISRKRIHADAPLFTEVAA